MSQMERIFFINRRIKKYGYVKVRDTASLFSVNERTIRRDIEYMRDRIDAPIVYDFYKKAFVYTEEFKLFENLDEQMIIFYSLLKGMLKTMKYLPVVSDEIMDKISSSMSKEYNSISDLVHFEITDYEAPNIPFFEKVFNALITGNLLYIFYVNIDGKKTKRKIQPLRLINYSGKWYIAAFCTTADDYRIFAISRISYIEILNEENSLELQKSEIEKFIGSSFGIFKSTTLENVTIKFTGIAMSIVNGQIWHNDQKIVSDKDSEELIMELPVGNFTELLGRVMSFGANAEVVSPDKYREIWLKSIKETYYKYKDIINERN
ncbi:MAG: WYL domain-containing protein [Candidatus Delongbacteria bacterium]|nr:WYL domain-containing protein [Candidatus Delongbacteria bacterium]MBN2833856.1 WYL domain-containing protein [Candidatus Delongbacteria bacterium]